MSPTAPEHPAAHDTTCFNIRSTLQMAHPTRGPPPKGGQAKPLVREAVRKDTPMTLRPHICYVDVVTVAMMTVVEYGSGFATTTLRMALADIRPTSGSREQLDFWNSGVVGPSIAVTPLSSSTMTMLSLVKLVMWLVAQVAIELNP